MNKRKGKKDSQKETIYNVVYKLFKALWDQAQMHSVQIIDQWLKQNCSNPGGEEYSGTPL